MTLLHPFQRLVAWFMPEGQPTESPETFKLHTIVWVSLLVGNSGFPFMVLFYALGKPKEATVILWSWVFFMIIPLLAKHRIGPSDLAHLLAGNYYQCHLFLCCLWGGVEAPNTMWFSAVPIVSVLVGSIRHGLVWGGISAVSVAAIYVSELYGWVAFDSSLAPEQYLFVTAAGTVALLAAVFGSTTAFEMLRLSAFDRRVRAEQKLMQANDELTIIDTQKTSFFQNVSHELRTPLTLILPPIEEAARLQPDDRQMAAAARNARRLLRLVNQLLSLQKTRVDVSILHTEPIDLGPFLRICADSMQSACSTKEIHLQTRRIHQPDFEEPLWVLGTFDVLEKIVFNFLSNALKFTPPKGTITLDVEPYDRFIRVSVTDTGPGIAPDSIDRLFREFSQVDSTEGRRIEGTGLGLALAKSLAEQLGGSVGVESAVGAGSTFWADLPRTAPPPKDQRSEYTPNEWLIEPLAEPRTPNPVTGPTEGPLVLVVDDLEDLREMIEGFMHRAGYRTISAPNGVVGLRLVIEHRPDVIITDWMMPEMSGVELIEAVRKQTEISGTPIVLLTAKSDEESRLIGTELGADSFLGKPFNEQELVSMTRNLIALKAREREVDELNQKLTETVLKRYLPPSLVDRIVDDNLELGDAELRTVTVLFSDICNFTATAEDLGPATISTLLNEYLSTMTDIVFEHEGTIDKFIGDGIMVMFGAPVRQSPLDQARAAIACAAAMQATMATFADYCVAQGLPALDIRIGIHQGQAVVGNFGSQQRLDYTCIGPMVNVAARIESCCPPGCVLVSDAVRQHIEPTRVSDAGMFDLKGIQEPQHLFLIDGVP